MSRNVRIALLVSTTLSGLGFTLMVGGCGAPATGPLGGSYDEASELLARQFGYPASGVDSEVRQLDALISVYEDHFYVDDSTSGPGMQAWIAIADIEGLVARADVALDPLVPEYSADLQRCTFTMLNSDPQPTEWVVTWRTGVTRIPWSVYDSTYYGTSEERDVRRSIPDSGSLTVDLAGAQSNSLLYVWVAGRDSTGESNFFHWLLPDVGGFTLDPTQLAAIRAFSEPAYIIATRRYRKLREVDGKRIGQLQSVSYLVILEP